MIRKKDSRIILACHMNHQELDTLTAAMTPLHIAVQSVPEHQEMAPLGLLAGAAGANIGGFEQPAGPLTESMIIMCGLEKRDLDQVLPAIRGAGLAIRLKAMLTPTNSSWNARQLQAALKQESAAMAAQRKRR